MKPKACKVCLETFTPQRALQRACSVSCAIEYNNRVDAANAEKRRKRALRLRKEGLRSKSDWLKLSQREFNAFIRLRDDQLACISCGRHHQGKWNAGHYRSVGAQGALRFNEINVHKQCEPCNSHLSGNISEYRINLVKRIGVELVGWLEKDHPRTKAWTVEELQAIRKYYREAQKAMRLSASP